MPYRRGWVALLLLPLAPIDDIDRVTQSFAAEPITPAFGLSPVTPGDLSSSFLRTCALCLLPMGMLVDRLGAKRVAGCGIAVRSPAAMAIGLAGSFGALLATRAGETSGDPAPAARARA